MEYYKLLQLDREPFSNSPDPEYFFNSRQHMECLQKLELALRLKRGLNVVIGDVGTGKTTLCRQLILKFSTEADVETHLILDPSYDTSTEFLETIFNMICPPNAHQEYSHTSMKEAIKRTLFQLGVDQGKTIILIIDEGQKISDPCLEILRELLNYETNTYKLLQIVIFAQLEFNAVLQTHANFADRINLLHHLKPLRFADTKQLIQHRLKLSSANSKPTALFSLPAFWAIYRASRGYPRKIIHLCHQSILALIIQNQTKARWALIQSCKKRFSLPASRRRFLILLASFTCLAAVLFIVLFPLFQTKDTQNALQDAFKIENTNRIIPDTRADNTTVKIHASATIDSQNSKLPTASPSVEATETISYTSTLKPADLPVIDQATDTDTVEQPAPIQPPLPPQLLGQLRVKPGDTLTLLTRQVYGTRHSLFLRAVIVSNPHIQEPDNIDIGNIIHFPSIAQYPAIPKTPFFMVVLDEYPSLSATVERLQKIGALIDSKPKMVVSWSSDHALRFQILHSKVFSSSQAAQVHINMLPYAISAQSKILSGWPEDTIFYSDPFRDSTQLSYKGEG